MNVTDRLCGWFSETRIARFFLEYQTLILCSILAFFLASSWAGNVMLIEAGSKYYNPIYDTVFLVLRYASYGAMGLCVLLSLLLGQYRFWPFVVYLALSWLVFFFSRSTEFMILMLAVGSMALVPRQAIFRILLAVQTVALTVIPLLAALGVFPNVIMDTERIRYSLGFTWVTSAPVVFVFASILFLYLYRKKLNNWIFCFLLQLDIFLYLLTDTKMAFSVSLLVLAVAYIWWKRPDWLGFLASRWIRLFILWLPVLLTLAALVLAMVYSESNGFLSRLNAVLSGRLANASEAWNKYGLSLFGQQITWTGQGITYKPSQHYLYVDCSYLNILLNYGLAALILVWAWCQAVLRHLYEKENLLLLAFFIIILCFSFLEVRLINPLYDPFVIAAGSYLGLARIRKEKA
ncbi:hypothetical protein [Faecalibaculum rodentium]|uniref:hypothetical protein n=1 Tax=Faecalibaculum rodentium TaxID=1702221 RepID=UPI0023F3CD57|nr:hypothetical protein [Faecalibaculum rodentium]